MDKKKQSDYRLGIIFIIISAFCFALMDMFIRLAGDVPTLQKCFFRNLFAFFVAVGALIRTRTPFRIGKGNLKYLLIRSVSGGLGMVCNFYAVDHMPISDASILNKLSPFFAIVFSYFILSEKADVIEWISVFAAFIGALFVVKPTFSAEVLPAVAGLMGGLGAGLAYTFVRKLGTRGVSSMIIVAFFSGFTTLMLTPSLIFSFSPMSARQLIFLVMTGITAAIAQIFITMAYSKAPAKEISVYDFSIVIFAAMLGFMFLGQLPDVFSVIGYITAILKWRYIMQKSRT